MITLYAAGYMGEDGEPIVLTHATASKLTAQRWADQSPTWQVMHQQRSPWQPLEEEQEPEEEPNAD